MTNINYGRNSFYVSTPQLNEYVSYLGFWQGQYILPAPTDTLISLDHAYNHRPDLLSFQLYNSTQLWWVFMLRNPDVIKDPIWDFVPGIEIYVPQKDTLQRYS